MVLMMRMRIIDNTNGGYRYFAAMVRLVDSMTRLGCWGTHPGELVFNLSIPIRFMYGSIYFTYIYYKNQPNVGEYR